MADPRMSLATTAYNEPRGPFYPAEVGRIVSDAPATQQHGDSDGSNLHLADPNYEGSAEIQLLLDNFHCVREIEGYCSPLMQEILH